MCDRNKENICVRAPFACLAWTRVLFQRQSFSKCTSKGKAADVKYIIPEDPETGCQIKYDAATISSHTGTYAEAWRWARKSENIKAWLVLLCLLHSRHQSGATEPPEWILIKNHFSSSLGTYCCLFACFNQTLLQQSHLGESLQFTRPWTKFRLVNKSRGRWKTRYLKTLVFQGVLLMQTFLQRLPVLISSLIFHSCFKNRTIYNILLLRSHPSESSLLLEKQPTLLLSLCVLFKRN